MHVPDTKNFSVNNIQPGAQMKALHHRDELIRAVMSGNTARIDQLAIQLAQAEELKRLHRALNHCPTCAASTAQRAPETTKPATSQ